MVQVFRHLPLDLSGFLFDPLGSGSHDQKDRTAGEFPVVGDGGHSPEQQDRTHYEQDGYGGTDHRIGADTPGYPEMDREPGRYYGQDRG